MGAVWLACMLTLGCFSYASSHAACVRLFAGSITPSSSSVFAVTRRSFRTAVGEPVCDAKYMRQNTKRVSDAAMLLSGGR